MIVFTIGRMKCAALYDILAHRMLLRFDREICGERHHVDGHIKLPMSGLGMKAARVVWADRAEVAFYVQEQASGIHKPSAAFIDYPHDWKRDAREMGK